MQNGKVQNGKSWHQGRENGWISVVLLETVDIYLKVCWSLIAWTLSADNSLQAQFKQFRGFKAPCHKLTVSFGEDLSIELGMTLDVETVNANAPAVKYAKSKAGTTYELVVVDYDRLRNQEDNDWLKRRLDIPGAQLKEGFSVNTNLNSKQGI